MVVNAACDNGWLMSMLLTVVVPVPAQGCAARVTVLWSELVDFSPRVYVYVASLCTSVRRVIVLTTTGFLERCNRLT